jgi:hypothetical protein
MWGSTNRRVKVQAGPCIKGDLFSKITKAKRAWVVSQVTEHLPSKCEDLFSNLSTTKKRKNTYLMGHDELLNEVMWATWLVQDLENTIC